MSRGANGLQLLQTLDESLFANLDVTTGAISWNFIYLASSPSDQARLRKEIERETSPDDASWDAYIGRGDTFLAACISEASRLRPVARKLISDESPWSLARFVIDSVNAAFSIPQAPPTDRKVGEWKIPARVSF